MPQESTPQIKALVVYESFFGNTEKVATAIADAINKNNSARLIQLADVQPADLAGLDFLIVGAPTRGGRPSPEMYKFLERIPLNSLKGVGVAAFDTRFAAKESSFGLRILMGIINYASDKITKLLIKKGGRQTVAPEGFIVTGKEGPLKEGELARASAWGETVVSNQKP